MSEKNEDAPPAPEKRTVYAPRPEDPNASAAVISVEFAPDEEVEWVWTYLPGGKRVVTGYDIKKKDA
jgi:hypothetical protein